MTLTDKTERSHWLQKDRVFQNLNKAQPSAVRRISRSLYRQQVCLFAGRGVTTSLALTPEKWKHFITMAANYERTKATSPQQQQKVKTYFICKQ